MKHRLVITLIIVFSCVFIAFETYASEGILPSGIKDSEIGHVIDKYIEEHRDTTAALSVAVFRGDETLYKRIYGYSNIEKSLVADDETVYEWGSVGKLLVWVSLMQLWEEGKVSFDEDIRQYLPEDFFTKLKYEEAITVINLMNHNAGFEDTIFQMCAVDENGILPLAEGLKATEPNQIYKPGSVVSYSNWSNALGGYIVEQISGQAFYEYVQDHIFKPLEMNNTGLESSYSDNPLIKSKLLEAEGYSSELLPMEDGLFYINLYPAGSVAGTLDDYLKFAKALVPNTNGSSKLFQKEETLVEMLSPTLKYPGTEIDYVNHGFWSFEFNVQVLGHGGNTNMYSSYLLFDPISKIGLIIMTNQGSELIYNYGLPPLIFGKTGQMASTEERSDISEIEGLYYSARTIRNGIAKLYTVIGIQPYTDDGNGNLSSNFFGLAGVKARQIAPDTFVMSQQIGNLELDTIARYSSINGISKFSSPFGEVVEADGDIWALTIAMILLIVALLWSLIVILVSMVRFIIQKIRKRESIYDSFKKYEIILCLAILFLPVNIISVANKMTSMEALHSSLTINIIISIILAAIPIVFAILAIKHLPRLTIKKPQKVSYIITMSMGFVMTFSILVLEMYKL